MESSDGVSKLFDRIKKIRENLKDEDGKWTQQYVATKIGVARVTYTGYENGTKTPPPDILNHLANLFEVTTDYLLGRTDIPTPSNGLALNSLEEVCKIMEKHGVDCIFLFDLEKWRSFSQKDIEELRNHFEYISHKAQLRNHKE